MKNLFLIIFFVFMLNCRCEATEPKKHELIGFPLVMYTPETSLFLGGGANLTFRTTGQKAEDRANSINLLLIYSLKNQTAFNLNPEIYFDDYNWLLKMVIAYQKFPDSFFGIGNDTSETDEENFTTEDFVFQPWLLRKVYKDLKAGMWCDLKKTSVLKLESDGNLIDSDLHGLQGGLLSGFGFALGWDSRDNQFFPTEGSWLQLYNGLYRSWLGSDFDYEIYSLDLRKYLSFGHNRVLALHLHGSSLRGEITFNEFLKLDALRGILGSRFRDRNSFLMQTEFRFPVHKRFSGVVFGGCGDVNQSWQKAEFSQLKIAGGAGIRYMLNPHEKINLRLDIGISKYGIAPYFQISEAF